MPKPLRRRRRRAQLFGRIVAIAVLAAVAGEAWSAGPALAHNSLVSSVPSNGETVDEVPATWTLTFSSTVPLRSASGQMVTGAGSRVDLPDPRHGASDSVIVFDIPPSTDVPAVLRWRLVSDDGHVISGRVAITVLAPVEGPSSTVTTVPSDAGPPPDTTAPATSAPASPVPDVDDGLGSDDAGIDLLSVVGFVARLAGYLSILTVGGLVFTEWAVARGTLRLRRSRSLFRWALAGLVVAPLLQLVVLSARLGDYRLHESLAGLPDAVSTGAGGAMAVRIVLAALIAVMTWSHPDSVRADRATRSTFGVLATGYLIAVAYSGHARTGGAAWLGVPASVVHLVGAAAWFGGLVVLLHVLLPRISPVQAVESMARFSRLAPLAVAAVTMTGVVQSFRLHRDTGTVTETDHGRLLLLKLGLVIVMLLLGAMARRRIQRAAISEMSDVETLRNRLHTATRVEGLVGLAIVGTTAALVASSYLA